ncbi:MAG: hypothetical protein M3O30_09945 [Planctomycetota bacterium]|nr:hypothetical protein [Planctomycetota bacterium]
MSTPRAWLQAILVGTEDDFWEREWLEFLVGDIALRYVHADLHTVENPSLLILSDGGGGNTNTVRQIIRGFKTRSMPIGILHLSDEYCNCPIDFYADATFVIRNYYRPSALGIAPCVHLPLGYKRGFPNGVNRQPIAGRRWRWFFAGEAKGARIKMLNAARAIPNGYAVATARWNDPAGLKTETYAAAMNDTVFALCPRGNDSVDTFRVYEALEAGAIPIVEDDGQLASLFHHLRFPEAARSWFPPRIRHRYRAALGGSYWKGIFGEQCPLPRIHRWDRLAEVVGAIDIGRLSKEVDNWWAETKQACCDRVRKLADLLIVRETQPAVL